MNVIIPSNCYLMIAVTLLAPSRAVGRRTEAMNSTASVGTRAESKPSRLAIRLRLKVRISADRPSLSDSSKTTVASEPSNHARGLQLAVLADQNVIRLTAHAHRYAAHRRRPMEPTVFPVSSSTSSPRGSRVNRACLRSHRVRNIQSPPDAGTCDS
jgi:hypothetical protein